MFCLPVVATTIYDNDKEGLVSGCWARCCVRHDLRHPLA